MVSWDGTYLYDMTKAELKSLIQESVQEVLTESLTDLDVLTDGISNSTITGKSWNQLVRNLASVIDEVKDFQGQYSNPAHGPMPNVRDSMIHLKQIVELMSKIKPTIYGMDDIERKDTMREEHPHGRYAQQSGATPFETPQDF